MSVGLGFLHTVLSGNGSLAFLSDNALTTEDFMGDDEIRVLDYIQGHVARYNVLPSVSVVEVELDFKFPPFPDDGIGYWAHGIVKRALHQKVAGYTAKIDAAFARGNDTHGHALIRDLYLDTQDRKSFKPVSTLLEMANDVLAAHDRQQNSTLRSGIPFGYPALDGPTAGLQGGDFVSIVARVSMGKTYLLLKLAAEAHAHGKVPMLVATEMTPVQYARRLFALKSKLPTDALRLGGLSSHLGRRHADTMLSVLRMTTTPFYIMSSSLSTTLEDVVLQAREKHPDCIYVDGAYLLKSGKAYRQSRFEQVSGTAETLKLLAQELNIPVIATYQTKRKTAGSLDDIYQSDIIAQLSSIVLSIKGLDVLEQLPDGLVEPERYRLLDIIKGREGEVGRLLINFDPRTMNFDEIVPMDYHEADE